MAKWISSSQLSVFCILFFVASFFQRSFASPEYHRYIIVGAGPGGLQLGHYMDTAERDYLILDKSTVPGSFFTKYPRWRQLISINKRAAGRSELDFSMRHDWNSLLSEPSHSSLLAVEGDVFQRHPVPCLTTTTTTTTNSTTAAAAAAAAGVLCYASDYASVDPKYNVYDVGKGLQFREYSTKYYPEADKLVDYMRYWASAEAPRGLVYNKNNASGAFQSRTPRALNIRYNVSVQRVSQHPDWERNDDDTSSSSSSNKQQQQHILHLPLAQGKPRFRIYTSIPGIVFDCTYLIWAGGLQKINPPQGNNIQEAIEKGWVTQYVSATTDLDYYFNKSVLIFGRGNAAFEYANNILEVSSMVHLLGRDTGRIKLALESHYPGDVRSVHSHLLETYLLKSMDALAEAPFENLHFAFNHTTDRVIVSDPYNRCETDSYGRATTRCFFRREYDRVISCSGWKFEDNVFDEEVRPMYYMNNKHPAITNKYESVNVPGLFFAGNLMHAHDAKKSSGGFIHGFRYLVRALHRILEEEEQITYTNALVMMKGKGEEEAIKGFESLAPLRVDTLHLSTITQAMSAGERSTGAIAKSLPILVSLSPSSLLLLPATGWPRRTTTGLRSTAHALLRLINAASGPYQMFGGLAAVIVLPPFSASNAKGFQGAGVLAAAQEPWSFYDENADTTYIQQKPRPSNLREDPVQKRSDSIINFALKGAVFEDVPVKLMTEKASYWASQLVVLAQQQQSTSSSSSFPRTASSMDTVGVEYIALTLEFGTGSSSHVPEHKKNIDPKQDPVGFLRAAGEWTRDPFSLLRANATLANPETSHFLHPVMRYYNTAINATHAIAEMHVIEDFHITWTMHIAHILPVLRFVHDVGARRAAAALAVAEAVSPSSSLSTIVTATSGGYISGPLADLSRQALSSVWKVPERENAEKDHTHELIDHLMLTKSSILYLNGKAIKSGEGWINQLSIQASDALRYRGARMVLMHFMDPSPIPPTEEEFVYLEKCRMELEKVMNSPGIPHFSIEPNPPQPPLNAAQRRQKLETETSLAQFYESFTSRNPGVALIAVNARTGFERIQAEKFGVDTIPLFKVYDAYRGMLDIPGGDFENSPKRLEYLVSSHTAAKDALYTGNDELIFPGYDREILFRSLISSGLLAKDKPELIVNDDDEADKEYEEGEEEGGGRDDYDYEEEEDRRGGGGGWEQKQQRERHGGQGGGGGRRGSRQYSGGRAGQDEAATRYQQYQQFQQQQQQGRGGSAPAGAAAQGLYQTYGQSGGRGSSRRTSEQQQYQQQQPSPPTRGRRAPPSSSSSSYSRNAASTASMNAQGDAAFAKRGGNTHNPAKTYTKTNNNMVVPPPQPPTPPSSPSIMMMGGGADESDYFGDSSSSSSNTPQHQTSPPSTTTTTASKQQNSSSGSSSEGATKPKAGASINNNKKPHGAKQIPVNEEDEDTFFKPPPPSVAKRSAKKSTAREW